MLKKYVAHLFILLLTLCALPTRDALAAGASSEQETAQSEEKVTVRGLQLLEEIKETIDSAIKKDHPSESAEILWPCSKLYYTTAQQKLAQLYADLHNSRSPAAENCLAYIEDYLEQLARFSTKKLHRNDPKIHEFTNNTLTNLVNVAEETQSDTAKALSNPDQHMELNPLDKKIQEKALQFVRFTRLMFLPPVAITSTEPSWIETIKNKAANALEEHPFMCGVVTTMVAIALYITYKKLTAPEPPAGKKNTKKPTASAGSKASLEVPQGQPFHSTLTEEAYDAVAARPEASQGEYTVIPAPAASQGSNECGYNATINTLMYVQAIEQQRTRTFRAENPTQASEIDKALADKETALASYEQAKQAEQMAQQQHEEKARTAQSARAAVEAKKTALQKTEASIKTLTEQLKTPFDPQKKTWFESWFSWLLPRQKTPDELQAELTQQSQLKTQLEQTKNDLERTLPPEPTPLDTAPFAAACQKAQQEYANANTALDATRRAMVEQKIPLAHATFATLTPQSQEDIHTDIEEFKAYVRSNPKKEALYTDDSHQHLTPYGTLLAQVNRQGEALFEDSVEAFTEWKLAQLQNQPDTLGIKRFKKNHTEETTAKSLLCNSDPDYYCAVLDPGQHTLQEYAPLQAACALLSADNSAAQLAEIQRATRPYIFYKIERNAQNLYIDTDRMKADSDTAFEQATAAKPQWRQKEYFAERDAFKRALPFYRYDDLRTAAKAIDKNGEEPDRFVGSLQAFQQAGKPLLLTTLEHSGTFGGTGHWTSQYIYGNDTIPPTHATIINRDSCRTSGTTHISGFLKRFIHNLLHLKLPTREQAQHLARSISAEGIASGYEEEITIKVPNMVTSIHTGRSFQDGWIDAPTTPSAAPEAPATSE